MGIAEYYTYDTKDQQKDRMWDKKKKDKGINELSKNTLKSYSKEAGKDVHADQRDSRSARDKAKDAKDHGNYGGAPRSTDWEDEANWLDKRAEKRAGNIAKATTKIAQKESALEAIIRLSKHKT